MNGSRAQPGLGEEVLGRRRAEHRALALHPLNSMDLRAKRFSGPAMTAVETVLKIADRINSPLSRLLAT